LQELLQTQTSWNVATLHKIGSKTKGEIFFGGQFKPQPPFPLFCHQIGIMMPKITTRNKRVQEIIDRRNRINQQQTAWAEIKRIGNITHKTTGVGYRRYIPPEDRLLSSELKDGEWKGQRCFIIGGGSSLKDFDFSKLKNELTIGINRAYEKIDCTINFAMDKRFFNWLYQGRLGEEAKERWDKYRGYKVWINAYGYKYPEDIFMVPSIGNDGFSWSLKDGLSTGNNSGYGALNLAVCLGANPIYLLGYDMKGKNGKQSWWHKGYPEPQGENVYKSFISRFEKIAPELKKRGIKVINLNPYSKLKCFEFDKFNNIEKIKYPVIISFYTIETGYEKEIERLKDSLRRFNLEHKIYSFEPTGTWRGNLNYKSKTILMALDEFKDRDIVFVDADAIIKRSPFLFTKLSEREEHHIAAHFYEYSPRSGDANELLSGTLWIRNSAKGRKLIRTWHNIALKRSNVRHQKCLKLAMIEMIKKGQLKKSDIYKLPFSYTCIWDYPQAKTCEPVIIHYQASRKLRKEVGYGINLIRSDQIDRTVEI